MRSEVPMNRTIEVKYGFGKDAEIIRRDAEELDEYKNVLKRDVVPEMEEIERRKTRAIERAYRIRVCRRFWVGEGEGSEGGLTL